MTETSTAEADFEEFVRTRSDALFGTALLLTGDRQLAEDLLQTALAQAWRSWGSVHTSHEGVVRRTLVNTYLTWWRRRWNGERPTADLPELSEPAFDHADRLDLRDAVRRLPRRQRAVVVLRYFEDLPEAEVASILGCSVGTVKSQAHRALAKLRDEVGRVDGANPERFEQVGERVRAARARRTAGVVALVVALLVGVGMAGRLAGGDGRVEPAPAPTTPATSLASVLDQPGWRSTDYAARGTGADIGLQRNEDYLELGWWRAADRDAYLDELVGEGTPSGSVRALGRDHPVFQVGDEYTVVFPAEADGTVLLLTAGMRRVEVEETLAALSTDSLQAWSVAAEGPAALTSEDPRGIEELVAAGPVPVGFDADDVRPLADLERVEALQTAAELVACAWAEAVSSGQDGDAADLAIVQDYASWPVFQALDGQTTYGDTVGPILSDVPDSLTGDWSLRLGCA